MSNALDVIENNLSLVIDEMAAQSDVAKTYPAGLLPHIDHMEQLKEWLDVGEAGIAYESIDDSLEKLPYTLSDRAAAKLSEAGRLLGFSSSS